MKLPLLKTLVIAFVFASTSTVTFAQTWGSNGSGANTGLWSDKRVSVGSVTQYYNMRRISIETNTDRYGLFVSNNLIGSTGLVPDYDDGYTPCVPDNHNSINYGIYARTKDPNGYAGWFDGRTGICGDLIIRSQGNNSDWKMATNGPRFFIDKVNSNVGQFLLNSGASSEHAFMSVLLENNNYKAFDVKTAGVSTFHVQGDGLAVSKKGLMLLTGSTSANYPIKMIASNVSDNGVESYNFSVSKDGHVDAKGQIAATGVIKSKTGIEILNANGDTEFKVGNNGYVTAREIKVTMAPIPDYVFEPDYPLLPLTELETYLKENKHLPNIPSAKEIAANGIGLGDFQVRQLEKIEELTLYILQLNERLGKLEEENDLLKETLSKNNKK